MRRGDYYKTTGNSKMYKMIRVLMVTDGWFCQVCGLHKGCNWRGKRHAKRSWKEYRENQWKN